MSYILDALKKADAERERGSVPGLHSQPMAPAPDDEPDGPQRQAVPVMWIAAGAGLCLIGVLSWQLLTRPAVVPTGAPAVEMAANDVPAQTNAPVGQPPMTQQAEAPPEATPYPAQAPVRQARMQPAEPVSPPAPRIRQPRSGDGAAPARTPDAQITAQPGRTELPNNSKPAPPASNAGQRVPTLQELPDDVRREIPQLTIGGAMYSETPASRMLIINSQVFHEGDKPYQGLTLEEIRLKSAVFSYRGYRYLVNY
jgi:general secretion pathway protein B